MLCIYELGLNTTNNLKVPTKFRLHCYFSSISKSRLCVFSSHIYVPECSKILAEPLSLL